MTAFQVGAATIAGWLALFYVLQQALVRAVRSQTISAFQARKILHLLIGLSVIPLAFFVTSRYLAAIPVVMIFAANTYTHLVWLKLLSPRRARWYALIAFLFPTVLVLYYWEGSKAIVVLAVLVMTFGDLAAALVGMLIGKSRVRATGKTMEGAAGNFVVSLGVLLLFAWWLYGVSPATFLLPALLISLVTAFAELMIPRAWDNPVCVMLAILLLSVWIG